MSHPHIRTRRPEDQPRGKLWPIPLFIGIGLLIALVAWAAIRDASFDTIYLTVAGKISETRIVVDHISDSRFGGSIFYRIEAHVAYEIQGQPEDRWLTASEITTVRDMLEAKIASHPQTCRVYWIPGHPENAKCTLP